MRVRGKALAVMGVCYSIGPNFSPSLGQRIRVSVCVRFPDQSRAIGNQLSQALAVC